MAHSQALLAQGLDAIQENDEGPVESNDWSLTWGFEFEFLFALVLPIDYDEQVDAECQADPSISRGFATWRVMRKLNLRAQNTIVERLRQSGLSNGVNDAHQNGDYDNRNWTVSRDGSVSSTDDERYQYVHQFLNGEVFDTRVHGKLTYVDIEVMSPVMDAAWDEVGKSLAQVKLVLETLKSLPTTVNESCGFHVHVGNRDKGYGEDTVKNLMTLLTMAQHQFNEIHPPHRLWSQFCILPDRAFEPADRNPQTIMAKTEACTSLLEVVRLFSTERTDRTLWHHYRAINLLNLTGRPERSTIEWRQHKGTLDFDEVGRWVLLASILLCKSNSINNPFYGIDQYVMEPQYKLLDMFMDLNLEPCRQDYATKLYEHSRDEELPDPFL